MWKLFTALVVFVNFQISQVVWSEEKACVLEDQEPLKIGCTVECNDDIQFHISMAQIKAKYPKIQMIKIKNEGTAENQLEKLDAVLSPGGHDINPAFVKAYLTKKADGQPCLDSKKLAELNALHRKYGNNGRQKAKWDERDNHEHALMHTYFNNESFAQMPMLGIGYGQQMMAAVNCEPLIIDMEAQLKIQGKRGSWDEIKASSDGYLKDLGTNYRAYEYHHQAVPPIDNAKLVTKATSHDGQLSEVIQGKTRPAVGVSFTPEAKIETGPKDAEKVPEVIFNWFLKQACENHNGKFRKSKNQPAPGKGQPGPGDSKATPEKI